MRKINDEDIINNLKLLSKDYSRISWKELSELCKKGDLICTPGTITKKLGQLSSLLNSVGIEYYPLLRGKRKINNEDIINNLRLLSKNYSRISWKELCELYEKGDLICIPYTITKKLGPLKNLLGSIGIEYYYLPKGDLKRKINREDIVNNLKFLSKKYLRLSWKDLYKLYKKGDLICTPNTMLKKLGSLKKLLNSVGIEYYDLSKKWSKTKIVEQFIKVNNKGFWFKKDLDIFLRKEIGCSIERVRHYFGTIENFSKETGVIITNQKTNDGSSLKGRSYENIYGKKIANEKRKYLSILREGKTFEDYMHSDEIASLAREKLRKKRKGKTFVEIFGEKQAKEIAIKMSKNNWWIIGKNEKQILDEIEKYIGLKIFRGFVVIDKNGKINILDGLLKEKNINIEIDERYHNQSKFRKRDKIRDKNIKDVIGCKIIRINERKWLFDSQYKKDVKEIIDTYLRIQEVKIE